MYDNKAQSRKWLLTINNPLDHGMTHDEIIDRAQKFNPSYMCLADEIGEQGTYHTHVFFCSSSPMRFSTVKKRFPTAHIDKAYGTAQENRDYIRKEGKWAESRKSETSVEGTFKEFGELPDEASEKSPKYARLLQCVKDGMSNKEILAIDPSFAFHLEHIDKLRQDIRFEKYLTENRFIKVHYLWGDSGTGKTRSIYEKHPPEDVYRITDYSGQSGARFDDYHGEPVIVFEEFHSQVPISAMLNFLDIEDDEYDDLKGREGYNRVIRWAKRRRTSWLERQMVVNNKAAMGCMNALKQPRNGGYSDKNKEKGDRKLIIDFRGIGEGAHK